MPFQIISRIKLSRFVPDSLKPMTFYLSFPRLHPATLGHIGRGPECALDKKISRNHAALYCDQHGLYWLQDNSKWGTLLNGKKLTSGRWHLLRPNDTLHFGNTESEVPAYPCNPPEIAETIYRNTIPYIRANNPLSLEYGINIPGKNPSSREIICIRNDADTVNFINSLATQSRSCRHLPLIKQCEQLNKLVTRHFTDSWEDNENGWQEIARKHKNIKFSLGFFIKQKSGCCRHQAAALQLVLQHLGFDSRYVRGKFSLGETSGRHAWVEVLIEGKWHVADPTQSIFMAKDHEDYIKIYAPGQNYVEIPDKGFSYTPGAAGTIIGSYDLIE